MNASAGAGAIVSTLNLASNAVGPRSFPRDRAEAARPGMYAWWADDEALTVSRHGIPYSLSFPVT